MMFMGEANYIETVARDSPEGSGGQTRWPLDAPTTHLPFLVYIAPYSFPLLAIPPLLLRLLPFGQTPPASLMIDAVLGATLAFHYHCIWNDFKVPQTDMSEVCTIVGFAAAMTFQLVFLIIALSVVMGMPQLIGSYLWAVWERTLYYYGLAFGLLTQA